jgi:hypothetical protein
MSWKNQGRKRRTQIDGQFAAREIKMLESPAFRVLSLSARRILDRLEIELAHHGGKDNGRLPVTYDDFVKYGMDRHAVAPGIRELVALGFAEITVPGRAGNAEWRAPNRFRITYKPTNDAAPTHEWKHIYTDEQAEERAQVARVMQPTKPKVTAQNKMPVGENTVPSGGNQHLSPVRKTITTVAADKPPLLSISRGGVLGIGFNSIRKRERIAETPRRQRLRIAD